MISASNHFIACIKTYYRKLTYVKSEKIRALYRQHLPQFRAMVENRNVVICGPASYLLDQQKGKEIDAYDTVIRPNFTSNLCETNPDNYGARTDIYCCGMRRHIVDNISSLNKNSFVLHAIPPMSENGTPKTRMSYDNVHCMRHYTYCIKKKHLEKISYIPEKEFIELDDKLQAVPTTGIVAIQWALSFRPKSLYLTGFTLFKDDHPDNYDTKENLSENRKANFQHPRHKPHRALQYFQQIAETYKDIIKLDPELESILNFDYDAYRSKYNLQGRDDREVFGHYLASSE